MPFFFPSSRASPLVPSFPRWLWHLPRLAPLLALAVTLILLWSLHRSDIEEQRATLISLIEMESGGFHYRGTTSNGKTSALYMAGSVCGSPEYLQRWRSTDNGLESTALSHCDAILTVDELKMIDARIAGESAYMLANGSAKVRANQNGGARSTAKWRLLFLSAGELSLSQHVAEVGKKTPAGAELRMADISADAGQGIGCFENLHGFENGHEFAKALGVAVNKYYGTAFPAFLERRA